MQILQLLAKAWVLYSDLGYFQQAKDNYVRALDIRLKQLGPEHVDVAASYNNLGTVYSDLGDFQRAKDNHAVYQKFI